MSPQDFLSKLPSLDELLEHPRVRDAADRWNRSAAAARVRTAMTAFATEATRRAESFAGASPADLLDRFVQSLSQPSTPSPGSVVNATGEFWGEVADRPPLPSVAIEAICRAASEPPTPGASRLSDQVLHRLIGSQASELFTTPAAALGAAFEVLIETPRGVVVARSDVGSLAPGVRLTELCDRNSVRLVDIGDAHGASPEEYAKAIETLKQEGVSRPLAYRIGHHKTQGESRLAVLEAIHRAGGALIDDLSLGRLRNDSPVYGLETCSAEASLAEGADLVVLSGGGLIGGPTCGVLAGAAEWITSVRDRPAAPMHRVEAILDAALAATLSLYAEPDRLRFTHPLHELLDTPIENLRVRAERLAPLIASGKLAESAEPIELPAGETVSPAGGAGNMVRLDSWGIAIQTPDGRSGAVKLSERLAARSQGIACRLEDDRLVMDLRTVFPREENRLLEALDANGPAAEAVEQSAD